MGKPAPSPQARLQTPAKGTPPPSASRAGSSAAATDPDEDEADALRRQQAAARGAVASASGAAAALMTSLAGRHLHGRLLFLVRTPHANTPLNFLRPRRYYKNPTNNLPAMKETHHPSVHVHAQGSCVSVPLLGRVAVFAVASASPEGVTSDESSPLFRITHGTLVRLLDEDGVQAMSHWETGDPE